jgi:hypothetical protein
MCCFIKKKECEVIVSMGVIKLNVSSSNDSPKKKKKIQKEKRRYDVDLEVIVVNWKKYK